MKYVIRKIQKVLSIVLPILVILVGGLIFLSTRDNFNGRRILVVQSGSMEPTIKTGSLILIKETSDYQKNDIVTYQTENNQLVTHRIIAVSEGENGELYQTKGDFNDIEDAEQVTREAVIGEFQLGVPYLGYVLGFAKTQVGLIVLLVIPGTIIIYDEFLSIKKNLAELMVHKRRNDEDNKKT